MGPVHQCLRIGLYVVDVNLPAVSVDTASDWGKHELLWTSFLVRRYCCIGSLGSQGWETLDWSKYHNHGLGHESVMRGCSSHPCLKLHGHDDARDRDTTQAQ